MPLSLIMKYICIPFSQRRNQDSLSDPRELRWTSTASRITFFWEAPYSWGPDGGHSANRMYEYQEYDDSIADWGSMHTLASTVTQLRVTTITASGHPQGRPIADGDELRFRIRAKNAINERSGWQEIRGEARASVPDDVVTWRGLPMFFRKEELEWS